MVERLENEFDAPLLAVLQDLVDQPGVLQVVAADAPVVVDLLVPFDAGGPVGHPEPDHVAAGVGHVVEHLLLDGEAVVRGQVWHVGQAVGVVREVGQGPTHGIEEPPVGVLEVTRIARRDPDEVRRRAGADGECALGEHAAVRTVERAREAVGVPAFRQRTVARSPVLGTLRSDPLATLPHHHVEVLVEKGQGRLEFPIRGQDLQLHRHLVWIEGIPRPSAQIERQLEPVPKRHGVRQRTGPGQCHLRAGVHRLPAVLHRNLRLGRPFREHLHLKRPQPGQVPGAPDTVVPGWFPVALPLPERHGEGGALTVQFHLLIVVDEAAVVIAPGNHLHRVGSRCEGCT